MKLLIEIGTCLIDVNLSIWSIEKSSHYQGKNVLLVLYEFPELSARPRMGKLSSRINWGGNFEDS